ncbi:MAG: 4a-hydroxytetrahydrobiopterin dehydratase [Alphaproteobacteria bacterium]|nr:MAG: 4a-hydroxytetrahydrobiopterin dehydratase [Alphaproteobacteria bacterium]
MTMKLAEDDIDFALKSLPGWSKVAGREAIARNFRFKNFNEAFAFMTRVAMKAEKMDHHPEWFNVFNRLDVTLATHDVDGLSDKDIELARYMNKIAG